MIGLVSVTAAGRAAAGRLEQAWPDARRYDGPAAAALSRAFGECDAVVCFLAVGATVRLIAPLLDRGVVKGLAHITGGGITDNVPRILPDGTAAVIDCRSWQPPPLFAFLQRAGDVPVADMYRTFNMGIGMILVVPRDAARAALAALAGDRARVVGAIVPRAGGEPSRIVGTGAP